ncbi:hypothetical protein L218DRAFT_44463 [Marasmius fiardii PR-910]|nr:hypothetical protein L218DRAFT_44463 [Marasmius fiardii PR-910]
MPPRRTKNDKKPPPQHILRPSNAFRSDLYAHIKNKNLIEHDHRQLSRMAGYMWNTLLPDRAKSYWHDLAKAEEHARMYPDYKYVRTKVSRAQKKKVVQDDQTHIEKCHQLAECMEGQSFEDLDLETSSSPDPMSSAPVATGRSSSPTDTEPGSTLAPRSTPRSSPPSSPTDAKSDSTVALSSSSPPSPSITVKHELEFPRISFDSLPASDTSSSSKLEHSFVSPLLIDPTEVKGNCESEYPAVDDMDELVYPDDFVATEDIPPLDLPAPMVPVTPHRTPAPAPEEMVNVFQDPSFPVQHPMNFQEKPEPLPQAPTPALPFDREIDNQFGCKFRIYNLEGPTRMTFIAPNGFLEPSSSVANHHRYTHCSPHVQYASPALSYVVLNPPPMSGPLVYVPSHLITLAMMSDQEGIGLSLVL